MASGLALAAAGFGLLTQGGAVAAAGQLPDRIGSALAEAARQAFGYGLHTAFAICAVLTLAAAAAAATLLRHVHPPEPAPELSQASLEKRELTPLAG
jgi:hypothetical protein